ncbi:hypothetical protein DL764_006977 [Monosporascus ibericus]|uniref:SnoaL-like domain-containing protein n=1 Tax=Monosporascus ibericus TaxID=155417 RepID=A0A4Q4T3D0_9PEZI|nr:hypothetical protein DL764_006977 [Monosporascus ibericus]
MASPYDIQTYLLDRANIHDTLTRLPIYYDIKSAEGLIKDVFAPRVEVDYTSIFGGQPTDTAGEEWGRSLQTMLEAFDATQHVYTGILIELPQPGQNSVRPESCKVVSHGGAHMVRNGSLMHNGGLAYFEFVRLRDLEEKGLNPWRISKQKYDMAWQEGNKEVLAGIGN